MRSAKRHVMWGLVSTACVWMGAGAAHASGFQLIEQSGSGLGNAFAGSGASAENASSQSFNPALLSEVGAREVSLGMDVIRPSFKFQDEGSVSGQLKGNGGDGAGSWTPVPNAYLAWPLTPAWTFGLGFNAPFGLMTDYDNPWIGAAQSRKFDVKTYNLNPALSWRVNDQVSLGFGLSRQKMQAEYVRTVGMVSAPLPLSESTATLKASDWEWGWNVGALFKLSDQTKFGASYRASIKYDLNGTLNVTGPSQALNAAGSSHASARIELPETALLSMSHRLSPQWELLGDASWTGWSAISKLNVVRTSGPSVGQVAQVLHADFRDTWRVALGANYQADPVWKWRMGVAYDKTPVRSPETRLVSLPDNDRLWLSGGAQMKLNDKSKLDFGIAYLYLKDARINNRQIDPSTGIYNGHVKGYFKDNSWIVGMQYSMAF